MPDIIDDFVVYSSGNASPEIFKLWAGISLVAGALERRVWLKTGRGLSFPSLYVFLIAHPGIGKKVIDEVKYLWEEVTEPGTKIKALKVAPDNMTRASFVDSLAASRGMKIPPVGLPFTHHSMAVPQEEWSALFPSYDGAFLNLLTDLWKNKNSHNETRRTGSVKSAKIDNPTINLLAGYQPALMNVTFPEEAWASGFTRRLMLIYGGEKIHRDLFFEPEGAAADRGDLLKRLGVLTSLYGQYKWTPEAAKRIKTWDDAGCPPAPQHPKLEHYNQSRTELALRLMMVAAASRGEFNLLEESDASRAIGWLLEAETLMPNIFQSMTGKNDTQILDELHWWVTREYAVRKHVPLTSEEVLRFIAQRATTDKVRRIYETAESAGYINRVAGTSDTGALWVPKPRDMFIGRLQ